MKILPFAHCLTKIFVVLENINMGGGGGELKTAKFHSELNVEVGTC